MNVIHIEPMPHMSRPALTAPTPAGLRRCAEMLGCHRQVAEHNVGDHPHNADRHADAARDYAAGEMALRQAALLLEMPDPESVAQAGLARGLAEMWGLGTAADPDEAMAAAGDLLAWLAAQGLAVRRAGPDSDVAALRAEIEAVRARLAVAEVIAAYARTAAEASLWCRGAALDRLRRLPDWAALDAMQRETER